MYAIELSLFYGKRRLTRKIATTTTLESPQLIYNMAYNLWLNAELRTHAVCRHSLLQITCRRDFLNFAISSQINDLISTGNCRLIDPPLIQWYGAICRKITFAAYLLLTRKQCRFNDTRWSFNTTNAGVTVSCYHRRRARCGLKWYTLTSSSGLWKLKFEVIFAQRHHHHWSSGIHCCRQGHFQGNAWERRFRC